MTNAQTTQTTTEQGRSQTNIAWKPGYKATFQAAFDAWMQTAPKGSGRGEFIISLLASQTKDENTEATANRLASLGMETLIDMQRRRREDDDRMLEQIADLMEDAKAKAQEEVAIELDAARHKIEAATTELASVKSSLESIRAIQIQTETDLTKANTALAEAQANLETERRTTAVLEAKAQAQAETIAALREAIAAVSRPRPEAEKTAKEFAAVFEKGEATQKPCCENCKHYSTEAIGEC